MKTTFLTFLFVSLACLAFSTDTKKQIIINLTSPNGDERETTVYFDFGITPAFVVNQDAREVYSNIAGAASIYSFTADNVACSDLGYSALTESATIRLGVEISVTGGYVFTGTSLSNFDSTSIIQLEDRQQNVFINLKNNFYAVQITDTGFINDRFFLHVSHALTYISVTAGCANNNGTIKVSGDSSILWTSLSLYDTSGAVIAGYANVSGLFSFDNLPEGDYKLALSFDGYYVSTEMLHVNGNYIVATIQPLALTAFVNQDISFHAIDNNTTTCFWDFGDGSQITGITNPTFAFMQQGVFTVLLICSNDSGCQHSDSLTITVSGTSGINNVANDSRNIWAYSKTVTAVLNEEIKPGAELKIYDLSGQSIYTGAIDNATTVVTLNDQPNGYYIVSVQNNNVTSSKSVVLVK